MEEYVKVAKADDIGVGTMKGFTIKGADILVANVGGTYYALEDRCPHRGARLSAGVLDGGVISCIAHGTRIDAATGRAVSGPGRLPARTYPARRSGGDVEVLL